ncbi:MAG: extracellular solute-binding protein [Alphaproteobacteria bacterium]|nr:extracellular solute-binding protein [Alphaproteobacteria bacterium]
MEETMRRRTFLGIGAGALLAAARPGVAADAPAPAAISPELLAAARKEAKVVWYTSVDLQVGERIARAFEAKYPGVPVQVERSGAERIFQRLAQERGSNIRVADIVNSSDAAHFIIWKRDGWLAPYVPEDVARHYAAEHKDPDGMFATWRASLSVIGYNTRLVKPEDAPKGFADLLDPRWTGRIVKAHPGYSGTILTATFQTARDLGWQYFEQLAKQRVMQVQSATDPPKKIAIGERPVMADGAEYTLLLLKEAGSPVEVVYPVEGTPFVAGPSGIFVDAPHPNAARLFQSYLFSAEAQQALVDVGGLRSLHPLTKEKAGRRPIREIRLMKEDAKAVEEQVEAIKQQYTRYFRT